MTTIPNPPSLGDSFTNDTTGVSYSYDGEKWVITSTPGSEQAEEIGEDLSALTSRVSDGETVQGFIQTEQGVQNNQINALETQLQLLANTTGGVWKYQRNIVNGGVRPPNGFTFYGTHIDDVSTVLENWADIRLLMVNKTDINGTDFNFTNFEVGDKIEIIATDASSLCIGTIETAATQENYGNMVINPDRTKGGPEENKEYLISVYRPGEEGSGIDLDILDERYLIKTGDTMTGALRLEPTSVSTNLYLKANSENADGKNIIDVWSNTGREIFWVDSTHVGVANSARTPTSDSHLTSKKYVDNAVKEYASAAWVPQGRKYKFLESSRQIRYLKAGEFGWENTDHKNAFVSYRDIFGNSCVYSNNSSLTTTGFLKIARPDGQVRAIGRYTKVETGEKSAERNESMIKYTLSSWYRMNDNEFTSGSEWWLYDSLWLS